MSEKKPAKRYSVLTPYFFALLVAIFVVMLILLNKQNITKKMEEQLGLDAVYSLYDFKDVYQLDSNMVKLKEITTEAVFNDLTIDNEQRTLQTYLKFEGKSVSVNIIKNTNRYVIYSLNTEKISDKRIFVFFYDIDKDGKICWYKEVEGIEFVNTIY